MLKIAKLFKSVYSINEFNTKHSCNLTRFSTTQRKPLVPCVFVCCAPSGFQGVNQINQKELY